METEYKRLSLEERVEIEKLLSHGNTDSQIASVLMRHRSTIMREIDLWREQGKDYSAVKAHEYAVKASSFRRSKKTKIDGNEELKSYIVDKMKAEWSPQQISARLKKDHGQDPSMQISHESIYNYVYVRSRGELRKTLIEHLRQAKSNRGVRRTSGAGKRVSIPNGVSIHDRPKEVEDRQEVGHWEGDLIVGKGHKSGIAVLCERKTRLTFIMKINGLDAESVRVAMEKRFQKLPLGLRMTMTYDQGKEMSQHELLSVNALVKVFFCDAHSPWQKGTIENTNGLIRQYFPKGTDFREVTEEQLQLVEDRLNTRPRKVLDWNTPEEAAEMALQDLIDLKNKQT
jgi:transposase, IS30 family